MYPRIPEPPAQRDDEPAEYYGARLVCWLLDDGEPVTLTDAQLDRASWAATDALCRRSIIGEEATPPLVYDRLEAVRRQLEATTRRRAVLAAADVHVPTVPPVSDVDGGRRVPVIRPVPTLSPAGAMRPIGPDIRF